MKNHNEKLTLDRPATYQITVPGEFNGGWLSLDENLTIGIESNEDGYPNTIITSTVDQAALHGILRRLYYLGLPLISVILIETS